VFSFGDDRIIISRFQEILKKKICSFGTKWFVTVIEIMENFEVTKCLGLNNILVVEEKSLQEIVVFAFELLNMARRNSTLQSITLRILRRIVDVLILEERLSDANRLFSILASTEIFSIVDESHLK